MKQMKKPKDGDILMLTSGRAAGCLVLVGGERDSWITPFCPDHLVVDMTSNEIDWEITCAKTWRKSFPSYIILKGRWK